VKLWIAALVVALGIGFSSVSGHVHTKFERAGRCALFPGAAGMSVDNCTQSHDHFLAFIKDIIPLNGDVEPYFVPLSEDALLEIQVVTVERKASVPKKGDLFESSASRVQRLATYLHFGGSHVSQHPTMGARAAHFMDRNGSAYQHGAGRRLTLIFKLYDGGNTTLSQFVFGRLAMEVGANLRLSEASGYRNSVISSPYRFARSGKGSLEQPDRPRADQQSKEASDRHNPLGDTITPKEAVVRAVAAITLGVGIMFGFGWFSWRGASSSALRLYGGLLCGLLLSGWLFYWLFLRHLLRF
jgi:hypothetical protein